MSMDKVREALAAAKQSVPHQGEPEANWCLIEKRHLETLCDAAREALSAQPAEPVPLHHIINMRWAYEQACDLADWANASGSGLGDDEKLYQAAIKLRDTLGKATHAQPAEPSGYIHPESLRGLVEAAGGIYLTGGGAAFTSVALAKLVVNIKSQPAPSVPAVIGWRDGAYRDSTPLLHVGDSAFEDWFQAQPFATQTGIKQMCRDSYAAGMGDPLVTYAAAPHPAAKGEPT